MLVSLFVFLLVLSILVLVHEAGHFLAAKKVGVKVEEFALGLPFTAPIISRTGKDGMKISLYPILFGGFVRLKGEDEAERSSDPDSLVNKNWKERAFVILAGVFMNFVLAILVISLIFTQKVFVASDRVHVEGIAPGSPAEMAGLRQGDVISSLGGKKIKTVEEVVSYTKAHLGENLDVLVQRDNEQLTLKILARKSPPPTEGPLGISLSNLEEKRYSLIEAPFYGTIETLKLSGLMVKMMGTTLSQLIFGGVVPKDVAGPIGIAQITSQSVKMGGWAVLQLLGLLSLNLAIVNVLPFPALDGGRFAFIFAEGVFGKKVKPKVERAVNMAGMALIFGLIILISLNDVNRILTTTSVGERLRVLLGR